MALKAHGVGVRRRRRRRASRAVLRARASSASAASSSAAAGGGGGSPLAAPLPVAVLGCGPGALATAAAMRRLWGVDAHVFAGESRLCARNAASQTPVSLAQNGLVALEQALGPRVVERLREVGCATKLTSYVRRAKGRPDEARVGKVAGPADPRQPVIVTRLALQQILAEELPKDALHFGQKVSGYDAVDGGRAVSVSFENGHSVNANLVVGADGRCSTVRAILVGDEERFLGHVCWSAVVRDETHCLGVHKPGETRIVEDPASGLLVTFSDVGQGYTHWQVRKDDPKGVLLGNDGLGGVGLDGSKGRLLRALGVDADGEDVWSDLLRAVFSTPESDIVEHRVTDRIPIDSWSSSDGRVVLLGDAAHGMHPRLGQDARMTLEDSLQLAECVGAVNGDLSAGASEAVAHFERLRVERCKRVQMYAAEFGNVPELRSIADGLDFTAQRERVQEFNRWISAFPQNLSGDPHSSFWRPSTSL